MLYNMIKTHSLLTTLLVLFISLPTFIKSQTVIYEDDIKYGNQYGNALVFQMPYCSKKVVKAQWKESVNMHFGKTSFKNLFKGVAITNANIKGISNQPVDIYYRVLDTRTDTIRIATAFVFEDGQFLSSKTHPEEYQNAVNLLSDYAFTTQKKCVEAELQEAYDYQGSLNDDYVKLQRFKGKLEKENVSLESKIIQTKQKRATTEKQLTALKNELQKESLSEKEVSKYTKQKESLDRKIVDYENDITSYQVTITENKDNITKSYKDIVEKSEELKQQKSIIQDIKRKIEKIQK